MAEFCRNSTTFKRSSPRSNWIRPREVHQASLARRDWQENSIRHRCDFENSGHSSIRFWIVLNSQSDVHFSRWSIAFKELGVIFSRTLGPTISRTLNRSLSETLLSRIYCAISAHATKRSNATVTLANPIFEQPQLIEEIDRLLVHSPLSSTPLFNFSVCYQSPLSFCSEQTSLQMVFLLDSQKVSNLFGPIVQFSKFSRTWMTQKRNFEDFLL